MVISADAAKRWYLITNRRIRPARNIISGIPLTESKVKPALSIPEQTGSHTTAEATATTKKKAETSPKENSSADEPSVDTIL